MNEIKFIEFEMSKDKDDYEDRNGSFTHSCFHCGRPTAENQFVHYTTHGNIVNTDSEDLSSIGQQSQGLFPIGSGCAKKYPKEFIFNR